MEKGPTHAARISMVMCLSCLTVSCFFLLTNLYSEVVYEGLDESPEAVTPDCQQSLLRTSSLVLTWSLSVTREATDGSKQ